MTDLDLLMNEFVLLKSLIENGNSQAVVNNINNTFNGTCSSVMYSFTCALDQSASTGNLQLVDALLDSAPSWGLTDNLIGLQACSALEAASSICCFDIVSRLSKQAHEITTRTSIPFFYGRAIDTAVASGLPNSEEVVSFLKLELTELLNVQP